MFRHRNSILRESTKTQDKSNTPLKVSIALNLIVQFLNNKILEYIKLTSINLQRCDVWKSDICHEFYFMICILLYFI